MTHKDPYCETHCRTGVKHSQCGCPCDHTEPPGWWDWDVDCAGRDCGECDTCKTQPLNYVPWNGVHEFRPWTVMHRGGREPWLAPGCTCSAVRSAGSPDESEESMRAWFEGHLARVTPPEVGDDR